MTGQLKVEKLVISLCNHWLCFIYALGRARYLLMKGQCSRWPLQHALIFCMVGHHERLRSYGAHRIGYGAVAQGGGTDRSGRGQEKIGSLHDDHSFRDVDFPVERKG